MISSASEFQRLRLSDDSAEQARATHEAVSDDAIWHEVIAEHPELKVWVVRNKTVPLSILRILATDNDPRVRREVAGKRKLDDALLAALCADRDEGVRRVVLTNPKCPAALKGAFRDE
jgi:hypothetical protein